MSVFAYTLRSLMKRKNISEEELAQILNISENHVYNLLSDYMEPDKDLLIKLSDCFELKHTYFMGCIGDNLEVNEPNYSMVNNLKIVPSVKSSNLTSCVLKESDIEEYNAMNVPNLYRKSEYISVMLEGDEYIGEDHLRMGDYLIVDISTTQIEPNQAVAFSKRNKPVEFRRYSRVGPVVTLYSYRDREPISFRLGDPDYEIIGPVVSIQKKLHF